MTARQPPDRWVVLYEEPRQLLAYSTENVANDGAKTWVSGKCVDRATVAWVGEVTWKRVYRPADPLVVAEDVEP